MKHFLSLSLLLLGACAHQVEHNVQVTQVTPVTVVQQTTVHQTVPVHVHQGPRLDCDMLCRTHRRACDQACVPTSWSPNMQSVRDSCEQDCRFSEFVCVGDCVRSGGISRTR